MNKNINKDFIISEQILIEIYKNKKGGFPSSKIKEICLEKDIKYNTVIELIKEYTNHSIKDSGRNKYEPFFYLSSKGFLFVKNGCWSGDKKRNKCKIIISILTLIASILAAIASVFTAFKK